MIKLLKYILTQTQISALNKEVPYSCQPCTIAVVEVQTTDVCPATHMTDVTDKNIITKVHILANQFTDQNVNSQKFENDKYLWIFLILWATNIVFMCFCSKL